MKATHWTSLETAGDNREVIVMRIRNLGSKEDLIRIEMDGEYAKELVEELKSAVEMRVRGANDDQ